MRADFRAFFDDDHREIRRKLLESDRGGEPGRPGANDHHIELHRLAGGQLLCAHGLLQARALVTSTGRL